LGFQYIVVGDPEIASFLDVWAAPGAREPIQKYGWRGPKQI
jgi:hypothetical protein